MSQVTLPTSIDFANPVGSPVRVERELRRVEELRHSLQVTLLGQRGGDAGDVDDDLDRPLRALIGSLILSPRR